MKIQLMFNNNKLSCVNAENLLNHKSQIVNKNLKYVLIVKAFQSKNAGKK